MSGRAATVNIIPGDYALSVGRADMPTPSGWRWVALTDVARLESGHTPSREHVEYWNGGIPWIGIRDARAHHGSAILETAQTVTQAGLDNSAARLLPAGTVCLSRTASVGYVVVMGRDMATSQDFVNWVCGPDIDPAFLQRLLIAENRALFRFGKGSTHTTIYYPEVKAFHVCLPPRDEQRRIVAKLEALQARSRRAREALDAVPPLLEKLRQSILAAAFRGDLTKDWRAKNKDVEPASKLLERIRAERRKKWEESELAKLKAKGKPPTDDKWKSKYKEPAPIDTAGLPELPGGWCWARADDVCTHVVDCHNKTAPYVASGVPLIRTTNIRNGVIDLTETKFVDEATYRFWSRRCPPEPGDVIFTREAPMGEAGMVPPGARLCMGQRMMLLRADGDVLRRGFLLYAVQAPHVGDYADRLSVGTGVRHLRVGDVEALPIPLAPSTEQQAVEDAIESAWARYSTARAALLDLRSGTRLEQAILAKAFRGELVPQDPTDDPAEAMLRQPAQSNGGATGVSTRKKGGIVLTEAR